MIVIIGAGIAGLSLGWQLVKNGAEVTILEQGKVASGASGAAGAWLEPRPGIGNLRALEWAGLSRWPDWATELKRQADIDIAYRNSGITHVATFMELEKLQRFARFCQESDWKSTWLEGKALQEHEGALSGNAAAGLFLPEAAQIDARKTCSALEESISRMGGLLLEYTKVIEIAANPGSTLLNTECGKTVHADKVVVASAHGTNTISGMPPDIPCSRPVRGVLLELASFAKASVVNRPVKISNSIVLPMLNNRLLVGSTHEDGEEERCARPHIVKQIMNDVGRIFPQIADLNVIEKRVGIRSLVGDGLLRLGRSRENPDIYYSMSHAGAGFLRAPAIAEELAGVILDPDFTPRWIGPFFAC